MLSDEEIIDLFQRAEEDFIERKATYFNKRDEIRQAICAFANDFPNNRRPGVIFIGQHDDRNCSNLAITDELLQDAGGLRSDGKIMPFPVMSVSRKTINGCTVAVIIVQPSLQPPVRIDGRAWIRIGPRRGIATVEEERRLAEKQIWHNVPFDMRPCNDATLADIDMARFELEYVPSAFSAELLRQNGRSIEEKMRALRLLTPDGIPTAAAVLLFGKDPRRFFPGAYIQFLRIDGPLLTDPIKSQKEIGGTITDQVRQLEELLHLNITTDAKIGGPTRIEISDYPIEAMEQLTRNAILHRTYESTSPVKVYWYSDRVEIHSPGGLYGDVTPETIWLNVTSYRNPGLAEGLKALGIVDRFGFGLVKAREALQKNGNPPLEHTFVQNFVLFTVRAKQ